MKRSMSYGFAAALAAGLFLLPALATTAAAQDMDVHEGHITILSPKNNAVLASGSDVKLKYNVHLSPSGNHLHIYVDDQAPIIDRDVSGCPCSMTLPTLAPGKHSIAVKEAMANHVLTGVQSMVMVTVK